MSFENLKKVISKCNRCGKNLFWHFPAKNDVKGFYGDKDYIFVAPQPHLGEFPEKPNDYRFYRNMAKYEFGEAYITDVVKCRGKKYKELTETEVNNCIGWLDEEIKILNPKAIIVLGDKAFDALLSKHRFQPILLMTHYSAQFNDDEFKTLRYLLDSGNYRHGMKIKNLITQEQRKAEEERQRYSEFIELLNKLRGEGKITAENRRALDDQWRNVPEKREWLLLHLKELQGKTT